MQGYVAKLLCEAGTKDVPVGTAIMITVEDKGSIAAFKDYKAGEGAAPKVEEAADTDKPAAKESSSSAAEPASAPKSSSAGQSKPSSSSSSSGSGSGGSKSGRVFASPLAKSLAKEQGYELSEITGTGPDGRIIAADVREFEPSAQSQRAASAADGGSSKSDSAATSSTGGLQKHTEGARPAGKQPPAAAAGKAPTVSGEAGYSDFELGEEAKAIAAQMTKSKQTVPHYYLTVDLNLEALLKLRSQLNAELPADGQITLNDLMLKAAALACRAVPDVNASWMETFVRQYHSVDINLFMNTAEGLVTPLVRNVGGRGLKAVSDEIRQLTAAAAEQALPAESAATGTLSVANLGMYGVKSFAPIVTPPQACILAIGVAEERVVPNDDPAAEQIYKLANCLTVTLSCDHRVVDGAVGAAWLAAYKKLIENPVTMLL